ncbi:hypothetical protein ABW21_db0201900 [Orbilia brochopaga]|nr:hypothetical protein ABW21_db0201900 [Drechslerella brochopaga]
MDARPANFSEKVSRQAVPAVLSVAPTGHSSRRVSTRTMLTPVASTTVQQGSIVEETPIEKTTQAPMASNLTEEQMLLEMYHTGGKLGTPGRFMTLMQAYLEHEAGRGARGWSAGRKLHARESDGERTSYTHNIYISDECGTSQSRTHRSRSRQFGRN